MSTITPLELIPKPGGIDWEERLTDLETFGEQKMGISAPDMDLIAMSMLRTPGTDPLWLIFDGPKHDFWNLLDRTTKRLTGSGLVWMTDLRTKRPRWANLDVDSLLDARLKERTLHDHQFPLSYHQIIHRRSRYMDLESECLRSTLNVSWMIRPDKSAEENFALKLSRVLSYQLRPFTPMPIAKPNDALITAVRMALIGNPSLNPSAALRNACMVPPSHAVLHGRDRLLPADHWVLYRVLRESFRPWTLKLLLTLCAEDGYRTISDLMVSTGLSKQILIEECTRLADLDDTMSVIEWPRLKNTNGNRTKYLKLNEEHGVGQDMRSFLAMTMRWWE